MITFFLRPKLARIINVLAGFFYASKINSNTFEFREDGWCCCLAEKNANLRTCECETPLVDVQLRDVDSIDEWLSSTACPRDPDFGSIDVDGNDYQLFDEMRTYRPRVLCVEYNPYQEDNPFDAFRGRLGQAGRRPLLDLAATKGYVAVAQTYVNLIFVDQAEWLSKTVE